MRSCKGPWATTRPIVVFFTYFGKYLYTAWTRSMDSKMQSHASPSETSTQTGHNSRRNSKRCKGLFWCSSKSGPGNREKCCQLRMKCNKFFRSTSIALILSAKSKYGSVFSKNGSRIPLGNPCAEALICIESWHENAKGEMNFHIARMWTHRWRIPTPPGGAILTFFNNSTFTCFLI